MNQFGSAWTLMILLRNVLSAEDVSNHPAWEILDSFDCGYSVADRIIGGSFAALGQFPWITRLGFRTIYNEIDYACGGVLVSDRHVLTAAHCVTATPGAEDEYVLSSVRMGEYNVRTDPDCVKGVCAPPVQDRKAKAVITHPQFNQPLFTNDLALILLDSPVQFNDYVTPICLPRGEQLKDLPVGEYVKAAGWGKTNMTTTERAEILKFVALPVVKTDMCDFFGHKFIAGSAHICAGGKVNEDACGGDSGGPLIKVFDTEEGPKSFVVGVVSFGPAVCGIKRPAVYTKVSYFIKWILDNILQSYDLR